MVTVIKNVFLVVLLTLAPVWASAVSLTLEQCVDRGVEFNPQMRAYRLAIAEAEEGISEAWSAFLPTFRVDYNYTYLENNSDTLDRDYRSQDSDRFTLRLTQPLFSGMSGVSGLSRARQNKVYREHDLRFMKRQLVREIHLSFYDILHAEQLVDKWTESVSRLESQREIAEAWVAQELAPPLRLMEIEAERYNSLQQLAAAKAALATGEARLREWLAMEDAEAIELVGGLQNAGTVSCETVEKCLQQALDQRPDIKLSLLDRRMAREDSKAIMSRNLPQVNLEGSWVDYSRNYDGGLIEREDQEYYTVAVNVSMTPFPGGRNIFGYRRQELAVKRLESQLVTTRASIVTEVKSRFQQRLEGKSLVDSAEKGLVVAREIYNYTVRSSKLGVSSLDDLLDAELRLTRAEVDKIDADFALQKAIILLGYAAGEQLLGQ